MQTQQTIHFATAAGALKMRKFINKEETQCFNEIEVRANRDHARQQEQAAPTFSIVEGPPHRETYFFQP